MYAQNIWNLDETSIPTVSKPRLHRQQNIGHFPKTQPQINYLVFSECNFASSSVTNQILPIKVQANKDVDPQGETPVTDNIPHVELDKISADNDDEFDKIN